MKKERNFDFDFVRAIATILIVIIHFNAVYLYLPDPRPENAIFGINIFNIYIGSVGVSLFLILSGAVLMLVYHSSINLKEYTKKRFLSIYPMYWIAFIVAFCYLFFVNKGFNEGMPISRALLTLIGFDGYFAAILPTFYILGEWFLGIIILLYIIFPILRKAINSKPLLLGILVSAIYLLGMFTYNYNSNQFLFPKNQILFIRLPEFVFGMYFVKYREKIFNKKNIYFIISITILFMNRLLKPNIDVNLQATYIGISLFFVLIIFAGYIRNRIVRVICNLIAKYSFAIFLVHHIVILQMTSKFDMATISLKSSWILFLSCCIVTAILSYFLFVFHEQLTKAIKKTLAL